MSDTMIPRESVQSSNIRSMGYSADHEILEVEFHAGHVYRYTGAPEDVYAALRQAPSVGSYLARYISRSYPYSRM